MGLSVIIKKSTSKVISSTKFAKKKKKCPNLCDEDHVCMTDACPKYGPCTDKGGTVLAVKHNGQPIIKEQKQETEFGLRGLFFTRRKSRGYPVDCRCYIPKVHQGQVYEKP